MVKVGVVSWHKKGATYFHAQLELPEERRAIKRLFVCNIWDVSTLGPTIKVWPYALATVYLDKIIL